MKDTSKTRVAIVAGDRTPFVKAGKWREARRSRLSSRFLGPKWSPYRERCPMARQEPGNGLGEQSGRGTRAHALAGTGKGGHVAIRSLPQRCWPCNRRSCFNSRHS